MVSIFPRLKNSSRLIAAILLVCLSLLPVLRFAPIKILTAGTTSPTPETSKLNMATVRQSPASSPRFTRQYDAYGRLQQVTNQTNSAYTRFVYETNDNYVHTYQTVIDLTPANEFQIESNKRGQA